MFDPRRFLCSLFDAAVNSAHPSSCMPPWIPAQPDGRVRVVGAGKAAAAMAFELERAWNTTLEGRVIVPYGHAVECRFIEVIEAAHPVPDSNGVSATQAILNDVSAAGADETVLCLVSGGGSSLLCLPHKNVSLAEKQAITKSLLHSGAAIHEINTVRKKLSAVKGGKLAVAAAPTRVITLIISDVPGNDAAMVASGPTLSDPSTASEALDILARYRIDISPSALAVIEEAQPVSLDDEDVRVLATSDDALLAATTLADQLEVAPYSLGDCCGNARDLARQHADLALQTAAGRGPLSPPCVLLSGGETTVDVHGQGRGGRNSEYALALAMAVDGHPQIHAIACDTDGIDGNTDSAGCYAEPKTLVNAEDGGVDVTAAQSNNDSYRVFEAAGGLVSTGPTRTNVNDFRAILVTAAT